MLTYLRIGALVVMLTIVAAALWYRGEAISAAAERDKAVAALDIAVDANKAQEKAIAALQREAEENDRLTAELTSRLAGVNAALQHANAALADLRNQDEDVRSYLDAPVPDALRRLYDR